MQKLKPVLLAIAALLALLLIIAAILPGAYSLERSVAIDRPVTDIYPLVVNLPDRLRWDPFSEQDPDAELTFDGAPGTVGSSWYWNGETIGTGRMTIEEIVPNKSIHSKMEFMAPQAMLGRDIWHFTDTGAGTTVLWTNEGNLDYPVGRFMGLFMDGILGPSIEQGLANLKRVSEALPAVVPAEGDSNGAAL